MKTSSISRSTSEIESIGAAMNPDVKTARMAGLLYLLMALFSMFSLIYADAKFYLAGDAAATAANITGSETLFRLGIVSNLLGQILFLYLAHVLYKLLRPVDEDQARLMVLLVIVGIPITMVSMLGQFAAVQLLSGESFHEAFNPAQLQALAMDFLNVQKTGIVIAQIFWGLWLIPFGWLVFKSGFIPKAFGMLLMAGSLGYLLDSFSVFLFPAYRAVAYPFLAVSALAEFATIFWLLFKGVKTSPRIQDVALKA